LIWYSPLIIEGLSHYNVALAGGGAEAEEDIEGISQIKSITELRSN
jgi:hypothetical protein